MSQNDQQAASCLSSHMYRELACIHARPQDVSIYLSIYLSIYIHMYIDIYTVCIYIYIYTHIYTYICMCIQNRIYIYIYIYLFIYFYIHLHTYTYMHIHTHTYIYIPLQKSIGAICIALLAFMLLPSVFVEAPVSNLSTVYWSLLSALSPPLSLSFHRVLPAAAPVAVCLACTYFYLLMVFVCPCLSDVQVVRLLKAGKIQSKPECKSTQVSRVTV